MKLKVEVSNVVALSVKDTLTGNTCRPVLSLSAPMRPPYQRMHNSEDGVKAATGPGERIDFSGLIASISMRCFERD